MLIHTKDLEIKAIIKTRSNFRNLNGLTFPIIEIGYSDHTPNKATYCLDINGVKTDFSQMEIIVVDVQDWLQSAYDDYNWNSRSQGVARIYRALMGYVTANNIAFQPTYNCPA